MLTLLRSAPCFLLNTERPSSSSSSRNACSPSAHGAHGGSSSAFSPGLPNPPQSSWGPLPRAGEGGNPRGSPAQPLPAHSTTRAGHSALVYIIHLLVNIPLKISHNIKKNNDCTTWSSRTSNFHFKKSTNLLKISISIIHIYIIQHTSYVKCYKTNMIPMEWKKKPNTFRALRTFFFFFYILAFFQIHTWEK